MPLAATEETPARSSRSKGCPSSPSKPCRVLPKRTIKKLTPSPKKAYNVVRLKFSGARPTATSSIRAQATTYRPLQVVPEVDTRIFLSKGIGGPENVPHVPGVRALTQEEALSHFPLLPVASSASGPDCERLTLVLDLDETLVHAALPHLEVLPSPAHDFSFLIDNPPGHELSLRSREVVVWQRPGLARFLKSASRYADIVVFTASLREYADPLLDIIDTDGVVTARLFRDSAVQTKRGVVKDLGLLGRDLSRVVIVDNDPVSFMRHPDNAVLIRSYRAAEADAADASFSVLLQLLEELASVADVRPVLSKKFGLRNFFRALMGEDYEC